MCKKKCDGGLGFRDLHDFNIALLGKQCWRIITQPDKVSQLLKARYFSNSNFFEAKIGANPSFVWRSFMEAQSLVKLGYIWRVGSGTSINVWADAWLPDRDNPCVTSSCVAGLENLTVNRLILADGSWDLSLLDSIFMERDKSLILAIPLSTRLPMDQLV